MLLLLLHLFGDYVTQTDKMASLKRHRKPMALLHAFVYTIPFYLVLDISLAAAAVIFLTHAIIDHYALARYVIFARNRLHDNTLRWKDCKATGFHESKPDYMAMWLLIITDNTLHLIINYLAVTYL